MFRLNILTILVLASSLSGCIERDPQASTSSDLTATSRIQTTISTASPITLEPPPYPTEVYWNDCTAFATLFNYPLGEVDAQQNPAWETPNDLPLVEIRLWGYDCARVSWGSFERPVRMIFEVHSYQNAPQRCFPTDSPAPVVPLRTIASLWVNDTELGLSLKETYHLPVRIGNIQASIENKVQGHDYVWIWSEDGQPKSELHSPEESLVPFRTDKFDYRLFWYNETGVAFMDLHEDFHAPYFGNRVTYGTLAPPMLGAKFSTTYMSIGEPETVDAEGHITMFRDHFCKEPIE